MTADQFTALVAAIQTELQETEMHEQLEAAGDRQTLTFADGSRQWGMSVRHLEINHGFDAPGMAREILATLRAFRKAAG